MLARIPAAMNSGLRESEGVIGIVKKMGGSVSQAARLPKDNEAVNKAARSLKAWRPGGTIDQFKRNQSLTTSQLSAVRERLVELAAIDLGYSYGNTCCGVSPATSEKNYPSLYISDKKEPIDLPRSGKATVEYRVRSSSSNTDKDGNTTHSANIEIKSIDPIEEANKKKEGMAKILKVQLAANERDVIQFGDPRPRNPLGEFSGAQGGPNSSAMETTYRQNPGIQPVKAIAEGAIGGIAGTGAMKGIEALKARLGKSARKGIHIPRGVAPLR